MGCTGALFCAKGYPMDLLILRKVVDVSSWSKNRAHFSQMTFRFTGLETKEQIFYRTFSRLLLRATHELY